MHRAAAFLGTLIIACTFLFSNATAAQRGVPIDVFLEYDAINDQLTSHFLNTLSGLSVTTNLGTIDSIAFLLDSFKPAANGIVFADSNTDQMRLLAVDGSLTTLDFIPQSDIPPLALDWVLSENGRMIAWAEITFLDERWQTRVFVAQIDGNNLVQLPTPPAASQPTLRARLIAVANDGTRLLLDIDHPVADRAEGADFDTYSNLRLYIAETRVYVPVAEANSCPCPANAANNLQTLLQLERPIIGNGYILRVWNLNSNTFREVAATDTVYRQGGNAIISEDGSTAVYVLSQLEGAGDDATTGIAIVDLINSTQRIVQAARGRNFRLQSVDTSGRFAIAVDLTTAQTFKLDLESGFFEQIADKIWLGTIEG